jgi:hypothetical protein
MMTMAAAALVLIWLDLSFHAVLILLMIRAMQVMTLISQSAGCMLLFCSCEAVRNAQLWSCCLIVALMLCCLLHAPNACACHHFVLLQPSTSALPASAFTCRCYSSAGSHVYLALIIVVAIVVTTASKHALSSVLSLDCRVAQPCGGALPCLVWQVFEHIVGTWFAAVFAWLDWSLLGWVLRMKRKSDISPSG